MDNIGEAKRLLQEAEAACQPKKWLFFSSAPSYSDASDLYNRAGNALKSCREWKDAGDAFQKAAEMNVKDGEVDESARKLLNAASCYKKCDPAAAIVAIQEALEVLLRAGRFHLAASHEKEIAEIYETQLEDIPNALVYYEKAAERYAGEDSSAMAQSCRLKAATLAALAGNYGKAAMMFEDAASESVSDQLRKYSVRDYLLKAGLCRLCDEDRIAAKRAVEGYPAIDTSFGPTREFTFLTDLIASIDEGDVENFTDIVTNFDKTHSLDDWKTKVLLKIKTSINEEPSLT